MVISDGIIPLEMNFIITWPCFSFCLSQRQCQATSSCFNWSESNHLLHRTQPRKQLMGNQQRLLPSKRSEKSMELGCIPLPPPFPRQRISAKYLSGRFSSWPTQGLRTIWLWLLERVCVSVCVWVCVCVCVWVSVCVCVLAYEGLYV